MRKLFCSAIIVGTMFSLVQQLTMAAEFSPDLAKALSDDPDVAEEAVARLRSGGPKNFAQLVAYRDQLAQDPSRKSNIRLGQLNKVIDQVGAARYSSVSGLYWHTDLDKALAEAQVEKKPILSLRMMGKLTDEYSCANSRFFRTTLYANRQISNYLRDHYILHWKSVRPVPKVTIDFGDGRKLERTLTGNSIHYILTSNGQVIDGLPGLYSPQQFLGWIENLHSTHDFLKQFAKEGTPTAKFLKDWHLQKAASISRRWQRDLSHLAAKHPEAVANAPGEPNGDKNPPAQKAAAIAIPKGKLEIPVIANVVRDTRNLETQTQDKTWLQIAELHREEVKLDQASIDLIRSENPVVEKTKSTDDREAALLRIISEFEKAIAIDTVRNEYLLHSKLHTWLAEGKAPQDVEKLNEKVYAELFLTPRHDPWIGLVPPDVYTGLTNGGVVAPR